jgi:hypothetical protein
VFNLQGRGADAVSLFGQPVALRPSKATPGALRVDLTEQPIYLHVKQGTLGVQPSPIGEGVITRGPNNAYRVEYKVTNQSKAPWKERVSYVGPPGWKLDVGTTGFDLGPGKSVTMAAVVEAPASANGQISVKASVPTPDGDLYTASFPVKVRPMLNVPIADAGARTFEAIEGVAVAMNRPEQAAVGRPPTLASLQETKYWKGPEELSASVKTAYSADGLAVAVRVHDANYRPPTRWPGVVGSAVELFFDFRDPSSLGTAGYTPGVYQFVLRPRPSRGRMRRFGQRNRRMERFLA